MSIRVGAVSSQPSETVAGAFSACSFSFATFAFSLILTLSPP